MNKIILKIDEILQQHVGRGRAIVDPKVIEEQKWNLTIDFQTSCRKTN